MGVSPFSSWGSFRLTVRFLKCEQLCCFCFFVVDIAIIRLKWLVLLWVYKECVRWGTQNLHYIVWEIDNILIASLVIPHTLTPISDSQKLARAYIMSHTLLISIYVSIQRHCSLLLPQIILQWRKLLLRGDCIENSDFERYRLLIQMFWKTTKWWEREKHKHQQQEVMCTNKHQQLI